MITSNENYDAILGRKLARPEYEVFKTTNLEEKRQAAISLICRELRAARCNSAQFPRDIPIIAWARTQNNKKELLLFHKIIKRELGRISIENLAEKPFTSTKTVEDFSWISELASRFYQSSSNITAGLVHQHRQYIAAYVSFKIGFRDAKSSPPLLAFVANDHSPLPVAFATLMRELRVPIIYFQHAEVTPKFPPLHFDYNVLRNKASKEIYQAIGPIAGRLYIIKRNTSTAFDFNKLRANFGRLTQAQNAPLVIIYLTATFRPDYVYELVSALRRNPLVERVRIKPHPGTPSELLQALAQQHGDILIDEKPTDFHIAIVGNSSIVTELLREGHCVWQDFGLDEITPDYYGYAARGLVQTIQAKDVSQPFWASAELKDDWLERFSELDPSVSAFASDVSDLDELRLIDDLSQVLLDRRSATSVRMRTWFRRLLLYFPLTFLQDAEDQDPHRNFGIAALQEAQRLFDERVPRFISMLNQVTPSTATNDLGLWLLLKRIEWTGYRPPHEALEAVDNRIFELETDPSTIKWLENMVLNDIIRTQDISRLENFWRRAREVRQEELHITRRIALLRWLRVCDGQLPGIDERSLRAGLSPLHLLKMDVQGSFSMSAHSHSDIEEKFYRHAPPGIRDGLREHVLPVYSRLRGAMKFMDVSRSNTELAQLRSLLLTKITQREPFSIIRLSDGEGYIFQRTGKFFSKEDALNRERHWWGEELPSALREKLLDALQESVSEADILGIPTIYRFLRDTTDKSEALQSSVPGRGLLEVLNGLDSISSRNTLFSDDKVNLALFRDRSNLLDLVLATPKVVVVSSARHRELSQLFSDANEAEFISVPTHFKTKENSRYVKESKPLPYHLDRINEELRHAVGPGTLCLVAAGVAGKVILGQAKRAGAVAVDVGSALDEWLNAGIHSLH
ncbi:hypothetical protein ONS87_01390 [Caldimonas thermodepolymerans]|uniref:GT-D fold domain-containing protein n=1 Tax=Caldimonas thermodepolymerans TaxID=215580 RepID=UPI002236B19D|nr:hypothetical protein [Caldimonas thermodepolymerans]UZG48297.1 hypothetical protein ONS87_01390 [Caldimonas thermodepolymerans]